MRRIIRPLTCVLTVLLSLPMAGLAGDVPENVPPAYSDLYKELDSLLDAELVRQRSCPAARMGAASLRCVDLLVANSNRGPALLDQRTLGVVRLSLDRFKAIGVECVKFALRYPLLRPGFPRAREYLAFYKEVVS